MSLLKSWRVDLSHILSLSKTVFWTVLTELTNMQKNPSKQTKPQTAPTHTAPGLKSPAFNAHFEEERYGKVSEDNFLLHQWLRLRQSCSVDKDGQTCVEVCFALMGAEKPRRVVRAKCPKNRGRRVSRVHQVTKLHNNSPLVTFLDFGVFLIFLLVLLYMILIMEWILFRYRTPPGRLCYKVWLWPSFNAFY